MAFEIVKTFVVRSPPDRVWSFLTDPEKVASCLPGAAITGKLDEKTWQGTMTVKVGPVSSSYKGKVAFEKLDAGSRTAEMLEPFEGEPDNMGIGTIPQDELENAIMRAAAAGIPSAVHAIGDAANRRVLDAFQRAADTLGRHTSDQSSFDERNANYRPSMSGTRTIDERGALWAANYRPSTDNWQ